MPDIGYASMPVIPTFKGLQGDLERGSSKALAAAGVSGGDKFGRSASKAAGSRFKGAAKSIVAPLVGAFAAVKVGNFLKDSVAEARESQKVGALTAQVIKTTGSAAKVTAAQVGDLSSAISSKTGIDDEAIQRGANLILTFKGIRNAAGKGNKIFDRTTQVVTDMAAAMAGGSGGEIDMKSASIQVGKALNDPIKGVTALSKVGVTFSKKQKAVIKSLIEGGDANASVASGLVADTKMFNDLVKQQGGDVAKTVDMLTNKLTPAQKKLYDHYAEGGHTLEAQKKILRELNSEFGGAAAAQTTAGEKAKVAFGNIKEAIGTALLPSIDAVENAFLKKGVPAIQNFVTWLQDRGIPAIRKFANKAKPLVNDVLTKTRDILKEAQPYVEGFVTAFNKLPKGVKTGLGAAAVLGFGATKIPGAKPAIGAGATAAKGILGIFSKKAPLPVYVTNPGFGGAGGGKGGAVGKVGKAAGIAGIGAGGLAIGTVAALTVGAIAAAKFGASVEKGHPGLPKFGSADNPMDPQALTPDFGKDKGKGDVAKKAEALKRAAFYAGNVNSVIDKLPGKLERGFSPAENLKRGISKVKREAQLATGQTKALGDMLFQVSQNWDKANQAQLRYLQNQTLNHQGLTPARQGKVDRQLGGGMYVENMNVHGTSLSEVQRDAKHKKRAAAVGARSFQ